MMISSYCVKYRQIELASPLFKFQCNHFKKVEYILYYFFLKQHGVEVANLSTYVCDIFFPHSYWIAEPSSTVGLVPGSPAIHKTATQLPSLEIP